MVQHLLIMTVATPLILLGAPVIIMMHGLPPWRVDLDWLGPVISHPVSCWLAAVAVVIGWHVPSLFEMGMRSEIWHVIEQSSFLIAGLLFWWPVIRPWPMEARWPAWSIPLYLFLATLPCDALSAYLCFCNRVVYSHYSLEDQACAGALMWFWVTVAYVVPAATITYRLLSPARFLEKQVV